MVVMSAKKYIDTHQSGIPQPPEIDQLFCQASPSLKLLKHNYTAVITSVKTYTSINDDCKVNSLHTCTRYFGAV